MNLKTTGKRIVEEVSYGMWVWRCHDGEVAGDDEGNVMNVFCMHKNEPGAVEALAEAAKHYGWYEGGKPEWWSGKRPISDEQLAEQQAREREGLVPDPFDIGAIRDAERAMRSNNGR